MPPHNRAVTRSIREGPQCAICGAVVTPHIYRRNPANGNHTMDVRHWPPKGQEGGV